MSFRDGQYNHGAALQVDRGNDWPFCDALLNEGRPLFGYASDDAHFWDEDYFGVWVQVRADAVDPQAILDSLKTGQFYSSQGPEIHDVSVTDEVVKICCSPARTIGLTGRGSKSAFLRGEGLTDCELPIKRLEDSYFRVTVIDGESKHAWTDPIWLD